MIRAEPADVVACYRIILGREADPAGLKTFTDLIANGQITTTELAAYFMSSPEFITIQQAARKDFDQIERVKLRNLPFEMDTLPAWNAINRGIAADRAYEAHLTREMSQLPMRGKVFVDCGANIGYFTMLACSLGARVTAFEPNARNVWLLQRNLGINNFTATVYPNALADQERLMVYSPVEGNGQIGPLTDHLPGAGQEVLRTVTLDKALEGIEVDVMKLDIEGAEWLALRGAGRILRSRPILFLEFAPSSVQAISGVSGIEFLNYFVGLGYKIEVVTASGTSSHNPEETIEVAMRSAGAFADLKFTPASRGG